jgi:hypothetical protein
MRIGYSVFINLVFALVTARPRPFLRLRETGVASSLVGFLQSVRQCSALSAAEKPSLYFKFGGTAMALVGSYLSDRYQCVSVGGILSELIAVTRGVVQNSVRGTLLF